MWRGLDPPGDIAELTAPGGRRPVGLAVQEEAEKWKGHRRGVVVGLRHLKKKRGRTVTGQVVRQVISLGVYVLCNQVTLMLCLHKNQATQ